MEETSRMNKYATTEIHTSTRLLTDSCLLILKDNYAYRVCAYLDDKWINTIPHGQYY